MNPISPILNCTRTLGRRLGLLLPVLSTLLLVSSAAEASQPGDPRGACCHPGDGDCVLVTEQHCIENLGRNYLGDGTVCDPNPCPIPPLGACCEESGMCTLLSEWDCQYRLGSDDWRGEGSECEPNPCPQPTRGACCNFIDGSCTLTIPEQCRGYRMEYQGDDTTCDPGLCAVGACCTRWGDCYVDIEETCVNDDGEYQGDGTTCDPNPCPEPVLGACCDPNSTSCELTPSVYCYGDYQGDGTTCDPNPCPGPPVGACCDEDNECVIASEDDCDDDYDGDYQGDDTECEPTTCDVPAIEAACCLGEDCQLLTEEECLSQGGEYQGDGEQICQPGLTCVELVGACCTEEGECIVLAREDCGEDDRWYGENTTCEPNPCDTGLGSLDIWATIDGEDAEVEYMINGPGGYQTGETPAFLDGLEPGFYTLTWGKPGHRGCTIDFRIDPDEQESASCDLVPYYTSPPRVPDVGQSPVRMADMDPRLESATELAAAVRPNPVRDLARIQWSVPKSARTDVRIFDASGRVLRKLSSETIGAGVHEVIWDSRDRDGVPVPTGIYFYRITLQETGEQVSDRIHVIR